MPRRRSTVVLKGTMPKAFLKKVQKKMVDIEYTCTTLGQEATQYMKETIASSVRRHPNTGNLADAITCEVKIGRLYTTVGIGNKDKLQAQAPYWRVVNDGGYRPPNVIGLFNGNRPETGGEGERFTESRPGALLQPSNPMAPMNYIENTNSWFRVHFKNYIKSRV